MDENYNNNSRQQRRRLNKEEDDRLSSLPNSILTDILSFLPIDSAAATSILSHRWRYLWTGVTRVEFNFEYSEETEYEILSLSIDILSKLTSSKLRVVHLILPDDFELDESAATEPFFREVFHGNVDQVIFNVAGYDSSFSVPAACFHSKSMDTLDLKASWLNLKLPESISIYLPNLKKLALARLIDVHPCFQTMFKFCPLLEDLDLSFIVDMDLSCYMVNVFAPNLKSFKIYMRRYYNLQRVKVYIDAPKLIKLDIRDNQSIYYFVRNPTALVNLRFDSSKEDEWYEGVQEKIDYHHHMFRFFQGLSSVRNLKLFLHRRDNVFTDLSSADMPMFCNLVHLETNCLKVCSLRCFPNLEHLEMLLWQTSWIGVYQILYLIVW